jgi:hypothetical protein
LLASVIVAAIVVSYVSPDERACYKNEYSGQRECSSYTILIGLIVKSWAFCDAHSGGIQAITATIIVGFTWALTSASFKQGRQTDRALKVSESALKDLERAFVYCRAQILEPLGDDSPPKEYHLSIEWINTGKTWTKNAIHFVRWYAPVSAINNTFTYPDEGDPPGKLFIGPGGIMRGGPFVIEASVIKEVIQGVRFLYVWGWCEYDDIFTANARHRTEFCVMANPFHVVSGKGPAKNLASVVFMYHGEHNGEDEDCMKPVQTGSKKHPF